MKRTVYNSLNGRMWSQACLALVCVTVNAPAQAYGHVAPPDGVSAQDDGPSDGISDI